MARALIGEADAMEDYCFPAHVAAGFLMVRTWHVAFAADLGRSGDRDLELPAKVLSQLQTLLVQTIMLFGHNRLLDVGKLAGWHIGAGELLEARSAILRACPEHGACRLGSLEDELSSSLAQLRQPLTPTGQVFIASTLPAAASPPVPRVGSCRLRAEAGGAPCAVRAWYLGTHEALFREVETMWRLLADSFQVDFVRLNQQGIYKPAELLAESATREDQGSRSHVWDLERKLSFRMVGEAVLDVQPAARKLRWLLQREPKAEADILLCTIPALACSAFAEVGLPIVMYAANPLTAQVPFLQQQAWLALFADLAADAKNQLLVSNTWSRAQFEYQSGLFLPMIPVHGLYTGAKHDAEGGSAEVLVYDRTSPLLARVLQALLKGQGGSHELPASFVHHASTDRAFSTFASFAAAVFIPGDVEQMAFYEFYSMELPVFVPADPGRYMWPRLPGAATELDEPCGPYAAWTGTWDLVYVDGRQEALDISCFGQAHLAGSANCSLRPLARMDERGFSHCLLCSGPGRPALRLRLNDEHLQVSRLRGPGACEGSFARASGQLPEAEVLAATAEGSRRSPGPAQPVQWDHDIFASLSWFLDKRLWPRGPTRARHAPFELGSLAAAREWAGAMDFFRFPAVGLFASGAELLSSIANGGREELRRKQRKMRAYNAEVLPQSLRQWHLVLSSVVP